MIFNISLNFVWLVKSQTLNFLFFLVEMLKKKLDKRGGHLTQSRVEKEDDPKCLMPYVL